ncbi:MAG: EamA family transporter RarD, partial [Pseudomonadota bacterium]|nr:EamA family transporter RarD [Pseudomonadota bacterium]
GGSLFMYGMITLALVVMIIDSAIGYLVRQRNNRLHGYREPQVGGFPPRRHFINQRIDGVLKAHRFRKIRRYQKKMDKIQQKLEQLDAK